MPRITKIILSCFLLINLVGCYKDPKVEGAKKISQMERTKTSEGILNQNKDADIICVYGSRFYIRAENQEKYTQMSLKINHELGEIKKKYTAKHAFDDYMSTKLPVGTKVYTIQGEMQSELLLVREGLDYVVYVYKASKELE
ncbi:hypothetical protein QFZ77_004434 [Paenibacillus sp. V4I3]|uniref:hypothetical protein n=1 Tax=unclassified Paenibacillus TaxID=185978 RepID=UPI002783E6EE|nr:MULTISPECIES: hypothetical protein [unclassified Paenibacillus]MDQ0875775.1 hypothetical protein [Paenibacillus sp. V4I3]MDQ0888153.1 hypothetical protein [Paenibacillus sp. V4I9]